MWSADFVIYMECPVENTFFYQEKMRRKRSPFFWACGCNAPRRWNALSRCNTPRGIKRGFPSNGLCCGLCHVFWNRLCHKKIPTVRTGEIRRHFRTRPSPCSQTLSCRIWDTFILDTTIFECKWYPLKSAAGEIFLGKKWV